MKILLIYANRNSLLSPPPIGLAYLSYALKSKGYLVKVLDLMFSKDPYRDLSRAFKQYNPDVVGISIRNLDNQQMFSPDNPLLETREYIQYIRKHYPGIRIVIGGAAVSVLPIQIYEYLMPDYGICGPGESSFPQLIASIESGLLNKNIPGLVWCDNGSVEMNANVSDGYNNVGADWEILALKKYRCSLWPASVILKTGCIYNCSYCKSPSSNIGSKFRFRDTEVIIDDIKRIVRFFGIRAFFFADPCFGSPLDKSKELLMGIIKSGLKIHFVVPCSPVKGSYDDEFFVLYKKAGGLLPIVGCSTLSERMLLSYKKQFALSDVQNWSTVAYRNKLKFSIALLFGGPGENDETVRESMKFMEGMKHSFFLYDIGLRILPKTELFTIAQKEGIVQHERELLFPKFYISQNLDIEWAKNFIEAQRSNYKYRMLGLLPIMFKNIAARYLNIPKIHGKILY